MGGSSSSEPPPLKDDNVVIPDWASRLPANSPKVFFDIAVNGKSYGRIEITLAQVC
jgi:hypothetical protein